jgi:hypothetical protein
VAGTVNCGVLCASTKSAPQVQRAFQLKPHASICDNLSQYAVVSICRDKAMATRQHHNVRVESQLS